MGNKSYPSAEDLENPKLFAKRGPNTYVELHPEARCNAAPANNNNLEHTGRSAEEPLVSPGVVLQTVEKEAAKKTGEDEPLIAPEIVACSKKANTNNSEGEQPLIAPQVV